MYNAMEVGSLSVAKWESATELATIRKLTVSE